VTPAAVAGRLTPAAAPPALRAAVAAASVVGISLLTGLGVADRGQVLWMGVQALMLLAVVTVYLSLRPDVLLIGWLFLAPLFQNYARYSRIGWLLSTVVYVLPVAVFVLHLLTSNTLARRLRWFDILPFAYVLLVVLSQAAIQASALKSVGFYMSLIYGGVLVSVPAYYFCAFGPLDRLSALGAAAVLLLSSSVVGAMAIAEHFTGWNLWGQDYGGRPRRVVSTLAQPAILGAFLGAGIAVAIAVLVWSGPRKLRLLSIATLVATMPALYFTYTRGPILATAAVVLLLIAARPRKRVAAAAVAVVAIGLTAANWGQISQTSIYRTRAAEKTDVSSRLAITRASLSLAADRPILGWGHDRFDAAKNSHTFNTGNLPPKLLYEYTSHDTYLTILVELGLAGLTLFLLPLVIVVSMTLRALRRTQRPKWFALGMLGIFGVVAITAFTTDMRFFSFVPALAWIAVGLLRRRLSDETFA
jgi:O-antigen ligase